MDKQGLHVDIFGARCSGAYSAELEHANEDFLYFADTVVRNAALRGNVSVRRCKTLEFLACRGCKEVSTLPVNFVTIVVGTYLKRPKHMNDHSRSWIQTREALRLVCEVPSKTDLLISILAALRELECKFLRTMTSDCIDRKISGMSYAIGQMDDLAACVSRRLHHFGLKDKLGIAH